MVTAKRFRKGLSGAVAISILVVIVIAIVGAAFIGFNAGTASAQPNTTNVLTSLQSQLNDLQSQVNTLQASQWNLPLVNQTPAVRNVLVEWAMFQAGQDRFYPSSIIVNQGDTVKLTFISNDTDAHTLTIGSPYNFQINDSVPGTQNYLLNEQNITTPSTNNSPGVNVTGTPGNITGTGTFVAKYPGIYEYFCVYHVQLGMFGYLIVLPNAAYNATSQYPSSNQTGTGPTVKIAQGSYNVNQTQNFTPNTITVVIGVNNTVTWVNNDISPHTVTSDTGVFNSNNLNSGQSWSYTFTTPGTYSYHCSYHPWMKGTVVVLAG